MNTLEFIQLKVPRSKRNEQPQKGCNANWLEVTGTDRWMFSSDAYSQMTEILDSISDHET